MSDKTQLFTNPLCPQLFIHRENDRVVHQNGAGWHEQDTGQFEYLGATEAKRRKGLELPGNGASLTG